MVQQNLEKIQHKIEEACHESGREPSEITLIAVTKTFGVDVIRSALKCGISEIGESYVQEMVAKWRKLSNEQVKWHFVGPLQRNKVKYLVDFVHLIHSVESLKVCKEIEKRASRINRAIEVLIEVNTSGEEQKHGIHPDEVGTLIREASVFDHVHIRGLMTMAPFVEDPEEARHSFRLLANIRRKLLGEGIPEIQLKHLSMGMTNDFEVAIEEGTTMIRIGTALFGEREKLQLSND